MMVFGNRWALWTCLVMPLRGAMMKQMQKFLMVWYVGCAATYLPAQDLLCRIEESVVQDFAETVFPLKVAGTKKVEVPLLGRKMSKEIPWKAIVSCPKISIEEEKRSFAADVSVKAEGFTWEGKVDGLLEITYDNEERAIVVQVNEATVPVTLGPIAFNLDVSKEVPEMPFQFSLPDFHASFNGKDVHVSTTPAIRFEEEAIVLEGDVKCRVKN